MNASGLSFLRADDEQRHAAEGFAMVGMEGLDGGGVAVVHGADAAAPVRLNLTRLSAMGTRLPSCLMRTVAA